MNILEFISKVSQKHYPVSRQKPVYPIRVAWYTFLQLRSVFVSIFGCLGAIGVMNVIFRNELTLREHIVFGVAAIVISLGGWFFFSGIRKRMRLGKLLHDIYHANRDNLLKIKHSLDEKGGDNDPAKLELYDTQIHDRIDVFGQNFVDNVAEFFRDMINEDDVGCAIRMLRLEDEQFETLWRSSNLSHRAKTSEPIPSNVGIGHAIRDVEYGSAIWIVNDIESAPSTLWQKQKNDSLPDINNVMVAPINGFEDGETKCMGLLFVTSKNKKLRGWYAEYLMAISDNLGSVLPFITEPK